MAVSDASTRALDPTNLSSYILDHIQTWSTSIDTIAQGNDLRKGQPACASSVTPDLSFRNTTLGESSFTSQHRAPLNRRALTPNSNNLQPLRQASRSPSPSRSTQNQNGYRRLNSLVVYYDGDAQTRCTNMYNELKQAQSGVFKIKADVASTDCAVEERVLQLLARLIDHVEDAAFKLLQEGDATKDLSSCLALFQVLKLTLETEWTQKHVVRVLPIKTPSEAPALLPPTIVGKTPHPTASEVDDDDNDDDDDELLLPNIRLTSRMAAR